MHYGNKLRKSHRYAGEVAKCPRAFSVFLLSVCPSSHRTPLMGEVMGDERGGTEFRRLFKPCKRWWKQGVPHVAGIHLHLHPSGATLCACVIMQGRERNALSAIFKCAVTTRAPFWHRMASLISPGTVLFGLSVMQMTAAGKIWKEEEVFYHSSTALYHPPPAVHSVSVCACVRVLSALS